MNVIQAAMNDQKDKLIAMCDKLGVTGKLSPQDKELTGKPLMKRVMQVLPPFQLDIAK
jgi:elongation factor 2